MDAYPNEAILLLRGKAGNDEILISDVLIPPLATRGRGFSSFPGFMLPMDLRVMGVSHSHPSGALRPSTHDLNHFYGRIMVITAHPFQSYNDIGVFNSHGDRVPHEVVLDHEPRNDDLSY
jgi:proteasome lid subunit RPN8/RPN11